MIRRKKVIVTDDRGVELGVAFLEGRWWYANAYFEKWPNMATYDDTQALGRFPRVRLDRNNPGELIRDEDGDQAREAIEAFHRRYTDEAKRISAAEALSDQTLDPQDELLRQVVEEMFS